MRRLKLAALLVLIAALVAVVVAYHRRDSIALDIANTVLEGQDVVVVSLSVRSLQTNRVEFSNIVLRHGNGTDIAISGLSFPLSFPSLRPELVSIERAQLTLAPENPDAPQYADALRTVLGLPDHLAGTMVTVDQVLIDELPPLSDVVWAVADNLQRLNVTMASVTTQIEFEKHGQDRHRMLLSAFAPGEDDILTLDATIDAGGNDYAVAGPISIRSGPWLTDLKALRLIPDELETLDANLAGSFETSVENGTGLSMRFLATMVEDAVAQYRSGSSGPLKVIVSKPDIAELIIELPAPSWTASLGSGVLTVNSGLVDGLPAQVSKIRCRSGIVCTANVQLEIESLDVANLRIGHGNVAASVELVSGDSLLVNVASDLSLRLGDLTSRTFTADSLRLTGFSGAQISIRDGVPQTLVATVDVLLGNVTNGDNIAASLPLAISDLRVSPTTGIAADFSVSANTGTFSVGENTALFPAVDGRFDWQSNSISSVFDVSAGDPSAASARITAAHNLAEDRGHATLDRLRLTFGQQKLSQYLTDWPYSWDLIAGDGSGRGRVDWSVANDEFDYDISVDARATDLAGHVGDAAFAGLNAILPVQIDESGALAVNQGSIAVSLLEVGVPLEDLAVNFSLDESTLQVDRVSVSALGGAIVAEPFRMNRDGGPSQVIVRPGSVQLQFMANLAGFDDIEITGTLSGSLPLLLSDQKITIDGGILESDPPGGVIRYASGSAVDAAAANSGLTVVSQALSNFEYDSLTSDVNYSEGGDLTLRMRLTGNNPDLDPNQPVNLNLSVENNIPQLLRSLQAVRSIEDILEGQTPH